VKYLLSDFRKTVIDGEVFKNGLLWLGVNRPDTRTEREREKQLDIDIFFDCFPAIILRKNKMDDATNKGS
jgi:hypothetical protein